MCSSIDKSVKSLDDAAISLRTVVSGLGYLVDSQRRMENRQKIIYFGAVLGVVSVMFHVIWVIYND